MEKENQNEELELTDAKAYQKQLEELEKSSRELNTVDIIETKEISEEIKEEKVDLLSKRKKLKNSKSKEKEMIVHRKLGFHRYYLSSPVKIKHVVLLIMIIVMAVLCIGKFMPYTGHVGQGAVDSGGQIVGEAVYMRARYVESNDTKVTIDVTVQNKEDSTIHFNPTSFKLYVNDKVYAAEILDEDVVYANGLPADSEKTYQLHFLTDEKVTESGNIIAVMSMNNTSFTLQATVDM